MSGYINTFSIIIDNVVVTPLSLTDIRFTKVDRLRKIGVDITRVPKRSYGSRLFENSILSQLTTGTLSFSDL